MAANPKSPVESASGSVPTSGPVQEPYHIYHAEAHILSGQLERPIKQPIESYGRVVLENTRRETLISQSVGETSVEGLISFKAGHTRVTGGQVKTKTDFMGNDHDGWATLSTAAIEGFKAIDIITADRVVAQVSTRHAMTNGHVPSVTFLGAHFENLQIGGYPVEVELDLGICGNKPQGDQSYLQDAGFLDRVRRQVDGAAQIKGLPERLREIYGKELADIDNLKQRASEDAEGGRIGYAKLRCSLVKTITLPKPIPGVKIFGNVIFIPNFGAVSLAEVEVGVGPSHGVFLEKSRDGSPSEPGDSHYFTLTMMNMQLGSPVSGNANGPKAAGNGTTQP
jgi:hypothetical protein